MLFKYVKFRGISSANPVDQNNIGGLCEEFNCAFYDNYNEMLDKVKPYIACIGTRFDLNGIVSIECLKRKVNCFTEKSIAHSFDILNKIQAAAANTGAKIIGMHTMRYDPDFYAVYKAVQSGVIGKPMMINVRKSYKFGNNRPEYYKKREFYVGTILWVGLHGLDAACWIGGEIDQITTFHSSECNFNHGTCESATAMAFSSKNGAVGTISADFYQPQKAALHGDDQLRVAGEKGIFEAHGEKAYLTTHKNETVELPLENKGDFFNDFCEELQGKGKCRLSMKDTFMVTEAALKAKKYADK